MIKISELTKIYKTKNGDVVALENINLNVNKGAIHGILGLSGAGKTTLLRVIAGLEKPDNGEIVINGIEYSNFVSNKRMFKRNLGIVFQGFNLLKQQNVFNNIAYPLIIDKVPKEEIKARVKELLALVGLENKEKDFPSKLSGGQVQRVAIARALASNPEVLLLDEITSALDPITTIQIINLLKQINKARNVTILIITHDLKLASLLCDTISIINDGKIIEEGNAKEVLSSPQSEMGRLLTEEKYV